MSLGKLRFTWREPSSGLVHDTEAEIIRSIRNDALAAREICTDCGIHLERIEGPDVNQGPATCALCLDADWVGGIASQLDTGNVERVPESSPGD